MFSSGYLSNRTTSRHHRYGVIAAFLLVMPIVIGVSERVEADTIRSNIDKCLDIAGAARGNGAKVVMYSCHGGPHQSWFTTSKGQIVSSLNGKCLDLWGGRRGNGAEVKMYSCHNGTNQQWNFTGFGEIISKLSGKCLDVWAGGQSNGADVKMYSCHGGTNQRWRINRTPFAEIESGQTPGMYPSWWTVHTAREITTDTANTWSHKSGLIAPNFKTGRWSYNPDCRPPGLCEYFGYGWFTVQSGTFVRVHSAPKGVLVSTAQDGNGGNLIEAWEVEGLRVVERQAVSGIALEFKGPPGGPGVAVAANSDPDSVWVGLKSNSPSSFEFQYDRTIRYLGEGPKLLVRSRTEVMTRSITPSRVR